MKKTSLRQNITANDRQWFIVDAKNKNLGQLSVKVANALRGRNDVTYTPHVDGGNYVVVVNTEKISVSGNKEEQKKYYSHSGYLGHLKTINLSSLRKINPIKILRHAVSGMLPKTKHRKNQLKRLFLIVGDKNPHEAQKPEELKI